MKKVLLVEDDTNKIKQIRDFFAEVQNEIVPFNLEIKKSYQSGLNAILSNRYDLILLDMSMHNFDRTIQETGGEFMKFAGEDILKEMAWNDVQTKTIVVTQYDVIGDKSLTELKESWRVSFPDTYVSTVYYSAGETNWKNELLVLVNTYLK